MTPNTVGATEYAIPCIAADKPFRRDLGRFGRPRISDYDKTLGDLGLGGP